VSDVLHIDMRPNLAVSKERRKPPEPVLLNVVLVKDNLYLLVVDAIEAEIAAPRSNSGTVGLFVLKLVSPRDIRAVCLLRST
jgi:hypothetical protein